MAVSADGARWVLINASPDIRTQILGFDALQPGRAVRDSAIEAVLLTDGHVDHTAGLLSLRESHRPLVIYCTAPVRRDLTESFPILPLLERYCGIEHHELPTDGRAVRVESIAGISFQAVTVAGKAPPYSPHRTEPHDGDNIALLVRDHVTDGSLFYAPGLAEVGARLRDLMAQSDCVLVDGTAWTDDDLIAVGAGPKRASEMGHLPLSGPDGLIETLGRLAHPRKILVHLNNTNPVLDETSLERERLRASGIEVAHDGMSFTL